MAATNEPLRTRTIVGSALILVAILMLLRNIGFPFFGTILSHWPPGMIILGAVMLVAARRVDGRQQPRLFVAYLLIAFGILFSLWKYHILHISFSAVVMPLILFLVGVSILRPERRPPSAQTSVPVHAHNHTAAAPPVTGSDAGYTAGDAAMLTAPADNPDTREKIDVFAILGGGDYNTRSRQLLSGDIVCILGGADIDLREADTREDVLQIDMVTIMGAATLKVPPHWEVIVEVTPLLGGISNKTICLADKMLVPRRQLRVTGFAFMGSIDIHN